MNRKHFRRIFSAVLTLIMVFTLMVPFANAASANYLYYNDVKSTSTYYTAVNYLYEHGIMNGTGNDKFSPKGNLTRAQLVTILWRMLDEPTATTTASFKDCSKSSWYYSAVQWAQSVGIASGYTDGTFRPDQNLTNQELFVFMLRFVRYCGYETWNDADLMSVFRVRINSSKRDTYQTYARAAAGWVNKEGLLNNANLAGNALCTRGDTALLVYNIYRVYQKKYGLTVVNTDNIAPASRNGQSMANMFRAAGADTISREDISYLNGRDSFVQSMKAAFSNAKALDICYIYLLSHGSGKGMYLFTDRTLSPSMLRSTIDKYQGTFVVFLEACQSGTFIKKGTNAANNTEDLFDAESFVSGIVTAGTSKRSAANMVDESGRIKIFCSSNQSERSYFLLSGVFFASNAWMIGCGMTNQSDAYHFTSQDLTADVDENNKVSMVELFDFAYEKVLQGKSNQHMVCYPENDDTIIFEIRDWEFIG